VTRLPLDDGPVDLGNGHVCATLASEGAWLSLGAPHLSRGFVELTGLPPFEAAWRGDPDAVRRYRRQMTARAFAFLSFGVEPPCGDDVERSLDLGEPRTAREVRAGDHRHEIVTRAVAGEPSVEQCHRMSALDGDGPARVVVRFRGRLDAHPLPEITDIDPPADTGARTRLRGDGARLVVEAPELPAVAEVRVGVGGGSTAGWVVAGTTAQLVVIHWPGRELQIAVTCALGAGVPRPRAPAAPARSRPVPPAGGPLLVPPALRDPLERLAERTRAYVLDCTAVRVAPDEVCLLTDHRILPLSWTRDAYWQATLLLAHGDADTVGDHLRWLWGRCERPGGLWMRSHHTTGAVKDVAVQADQQLYPLLELAAYHAATGTLPAPPGGGSVPDWWAERVDELWDALPTGELGLPSSEENAADDAAELPYPVSAQILRWVAATRLRALGLPSPEPAGAGPFEVEGPFGIQWAYEIDGRGRHRLYHDANDLPTALAPLLGFCAADHPPWVATMRYAFSEHNAGWCPGPFGGLGSHHTPGTWTLGDVQEWAAASLLGEPERAERALARLLAVATPDGLLPEAYDSRSGDSPVRHWFAWPGAALGTLLAGAA
jgi:hypothetical protein